jgi:hypothetical protein
MILNLYYVLLNNKNFLSYSIYFNIFLMIFDNFFHKIKDKCPQNFSFEYTWSYYIESNWSDFREEYKSHTFS